MKTSDFAFNLPESLIAQVPLKERDRSKLLFLNRNNGKCEHYNFYDIENLLKPGDLLVMNDSKVIPARIFGTRVPTGGRVQFLLLRQISSNSWETLVKPGRKAKVGDSFEFLKGVLEGEVVEVVEGGNRIVEFKYEGNFHDILEKIGQMPLPEYIHQELKEKERYQTVYARELGSAAAPTAGLHFTNELLEKLENKGINHAYVTLHVGLGTFRPVKVEDIQDHRMHSEHYEISQETADKIKRTKENGGRVIAVGTTACRTLESTMTYKNEMVANSAETSIFIYPGYEFKIIDGLITNFHLPESTLIMLVSAFAGKENTLNAYKTAIENEYRFYSFGDAMLLL